MDLEIEKIGEQALKELSTAKTEEELERIRIKYLGRKKGLIHQITKKIPSLPKRDRAGIGTKVRKVNRKIEEILSGALESRKKAEKSETIDVTTPGKKIEPGNLHPLSTVIDEVNEIFHYLGFSWTDGPEVENDLYNFKKLNIPPDHPSRDVQQTYYLDKNLLLRTHTSSMQVRYMEKNKPPIRVLFPGRTYRRDMPDATHFPSFFQIEGLMVDDQVKMTDLLGILDYFAKSFFGKKSKIRVYGHNFPYTEPSIEVEVYHPTKGWLEILGAGMVHPNVLKEGRIDPAKYQGWAFGVGADRLAMLKYGIDDIRILFANDLRFLKQF